MLALLVAGGTMLLPGSHPGSIADNLASPSVFAAPSPSSVSDAALRAYARLPLMFEPNQGQTDPQVRFIARGGGYGLFLTDQEAVLALENAKAGKSDRKSSVVRMRLAGSNQNPRLEGTEPLPGKSNYFIGNDPAKWRRNIPQYARVRYSQIYPGVDLVYYGNQGRLEYDFQVAPGATPENIQIDFEGARKLKLEAGDLVLSTANGDVRLAAPVIYQGHNTTRRAIDGSFVLLSENRVGFKIRDYDRSQTLIIDPVLSYSTYLGGTGTEMLPSIAVDSAGSIYATGATNSTNFPVTDGSTPHGDFDVFIAKFQPGGATLAFATYLGAAGADTSVGIAADAATNVYVAGTTNSTNFPTTAATAFQATPLAPGNAHAFVTQLGSDGTLKYSTYLSGTGTDTAKGMTLDNKGFVYVIGITDSHDFPLAPTAGTFQSSLQGPNAFFISKVAPTSSGANSLVFSTYFGGGFPNTAGVTGGAIAVDNNANGSNIYFTGGTTYLFTGQNSTTDFPIKNAFQSCLGNPTVSANCPTTGSTVANPDAFVAKLNPGTNTGALLLYCTYIGGANSDVGLGIGVDASGNAYVTGSTNSSDHPAESGSITPYQADLKGGMDAFVAKINNPAIGSGSTNVLLTYFSYLGGSANDQGNAIAVDGVQGARVIGTTASSDLAMVNPISGQSTYRGGATDAFVARLDTLGTTASTSQFVSFLGGAGTDTGTSITIDTDSNTYVAGETMSTDFPKVNAFQGTLGAPQDAFIAKIGPSLNFDITPPTVSSSSVNAGNQFSLTYTIKNNGDTTSNVTFTDNLSAGSGSAPVTFVSASASGGSCPTTPTDNKVLCNLGTINGGSSTTVTVNLTPSGPGTIANSGTVSVGAFSKTAIAPAVTVNSFKLTPLKTNNTVVAGNPATYPIQLTPLSVYTASISIACSSGLPSSSTCSPSTNPVTLQNSSPSTVTLVIGTTPRVTTTAGLKPGRGLFYASWLPVTGLAFLGLSLGSGFKPGHRLMGGLLFLALATLILLQPACSGHSSSTTTTGTPAGTYTITVSATSGSFSQTTPITLVVQ
jgi:hypothetical protein